MARPPSLRLESAGESFGTVLATRDVGGFRLRESRYAAGLALPRHEHVEPYFSLVVRGQLRERDPRREASYDAGSLHFHPGADPHSGCVGASELVCLSLTPSGSVARLLDARLPTSMPFDSPGLALLARRCLGEFDRSDTASDLALEAHCLELVAVSLRRAAPARSAPPRWLLEVRDVLHGSLDRRVGLAELARVAGVHPAHLARVFRSHLGCAPGSYLRRLRIERARRALVTTPAPIAEIAFDAGFASQAHFTRAFHRLVGFPPAAYRRRFSGDPRSKTASPLVS
jgi:AraC family transcriptional regulator